MKHLRPALVLTFFFIVVTGLLFPFIVTAIAQVALPKQANGSMLEVNGKVVGSELIGQAFAGAGFFHPRPSAAGSGYDANSSSGTNLGPTNPKLLTGADGFDGVEQLAASYRKLNGVAADVKLPVDAVTRSASGLDPHISVRNAELQAARVARARGLNESRVRALIAANTAQPLAGVLGEPMVNVLKLNIALAKG
ncbi:MAG: potassium-transporting ATPase subunit KdpC [Chthonomonas sp.]|nr:potassium-transporting ATPase subunit KdpC [Chthonomonas sp.]